MFAPASRSAADAPASAPPTDDSHPTAPGPAARSAAATSSQGAAGHSGSHPARSVDVGRRCAGHSAPSFASAHVNRAVAASTAAGSGGASRVAAGAGAASAAGASASARSVAARSARLPRRRIRCSGSLCSGSGTAAGVDSGVVGGAGAGACSGSAAGTDSAERRVRAPTSGVSGHPHRDSGRPASDAGQSWPGVHAEVRRPAYSASENSNPNRLIGRAPWRPVRVTATRTLRPIIVYMRRFRTCRAVLLSTWILWGAVSAAAEMTTLPCVPDCRGVQLAGETLTNLNLNGVDLVNADLSDATLIGVSLVGADLTGASLWCASLVDTDLTAATLIRANLGKVDLSGDGGRPAVLIRANLVGADLSGADLSYVNFTAAYLGSSILTGATMIDTVGCDDSRRLPGCYLNQVTESSTAPN